MVISKVIKIEIDEKLTATNITAYIATARFMHLLLSDRYAYKMLLAEI